MRIFGSNVMNDFFDTDLKEIVNKYYSSFQNLNEGDAGTRFKSWEYCHQFFLDNKDKFKGKFKDGVLVKNEDLTSEQKSIRDLMSLHLGFYLASWGMYRGSSFLLNRDYKAHLKAVDIILEPKYESLWNFNPTDEETIDSVYKLLFGDPHRKSDNKNDCGIYWRIKEDAYRSISIQDCNLSLSHNSSSKDSVPTDTLVTKILLGTFACIPAFDRFFEKGVRFCNKKVPKEEKISSNLESNPQRTFKAISKFALTHSDSINSLINDENFEGLKDYPVMKIVDMYFWQKGYDAPSSNGNN